MEKQINPEDIPVETLYQNSIVQQLLQKIDKIQNQDLEKDVKIPFVIKDKILMSPGVWNSYFYSSESIQDAFLKSEWDQKEVRSLFLDHEDLKSAEWIGEVMNPRMEGDNLIGDLVIIDKPTAMKLAFGAKMGISPKVSGGEEEGRMVQFKYDNFSVVINPAVKTAYINNQEVSKMTEEKIKVASQPPADKTVENKNAKLSDDSEDLIQSLADIEAEMQGNVGAIAKRAKEIKAKSPDMKWSDAVKEATKSMSEELAQKESENTQKELSDRIDKVLALAEEIKQLKKKINPTCNDKEMQEEVKEEVKSEPVAEKAPVEETKEEPAVVEAEKKPEPEETKEMQEELEKKNKIIQEMSERLDSVEQKLNEPDKMSRKTEELSHSDNQDPDVAFLNMLKNM